jgi:predicted ABC-type ATPase
LRKTGYDFHLVFLWLPNEDFAVARVAERVRMGGHNVPEETIRRRYKTGLRNFFQLYKPLTDFWRFYDNSDPSGPRLIASGSRNQNDDIQDVEIWAKIMGEFKYGKEV